MVATAATVLISRAKSATRKSSRRRFSFIAGLLREDELLVADAGVADRFVYHLVGNLRNHPARLRFGWEPVDRVEVDECLARLDAGRGVDCDAIRPVVVLVRMHVALAAAAGSIADERRRVEAGRAAAYVLFGVGRRADR